MRQRREGREGGFTLIEMLVVIAIILTLMALLVVLIKGMIDKARWAKTASTIRMCDQACHTYRIDFGIWPKDDKGGDSKSLHYYLGRDRLIRAFESNAPSVPIIRKPPLIEFNADTLDLVGNAVPDPNSPLDVIDAWGKHIRYRSSAPTYNKQAVDIWSQGANGTLEGDPTNSAFDDVTNWVKDF